MQPAAIDPQTNGAGGQKAPGLQSPQRGHQGAAGMDPPAPGPGVTTRVTLRGEEDTGGDRCCCPGNTTERWVIPPQR
ncbi:hypothetical protein N7449_012535 [Penicillium cf. viridicatum]|uniref:Uncharacterized protein n=1 Tax=Penicillium cf. viridicatum TaxID=2972119 RepID=A0A9W9LXM6_9EURO|nr:hypothetical protein N7449_012535 [Penicillium cf. viridicatum]